VGALILAGAVNTAIIGSNGVLNRVAEDGVLPDWFRNPHKRFGTTSRLINLIVGLQILTILISRGDLYLLGEAYAFGVVWSFAMKSLSVLVLRYKIREGREWRVPLNFKFGKFELPLGLVLITLVLFALAIVNLLTKKTATISGIIFTVTFFILLANTIWTPTGLLDGYSSPVQQSRHAGREGGQARRTARRAGPDPNEVILETAAKLKSGVIMIGVSGKMPVEAFAKSFGDAWENLPAPRPKLSLEIVSPDMTERNFINLGPHPPRTLARGRRLLHRLWLEMAQSQPRPGAASPRHRSRGVAPAGARLAFRPSRGDRG
jgi:hypothetical protein